MPLTSEEQERVAELEILRDNLQQQIELRRQQRIEELENRKAQIERDVAERKRTQKIEQIRTAKWWEKVGSPFYPLGKTWEAYQMEQASGLGFMKEAIQEPGLSSLYKFPAGALQYAFSPQTAVGRGIVASPFEEIGAPAIGTGLESAFYFLPAGHIAKAVRPQVPGLRAYEQMKKGPIRPKITLKREEGITGIPIRPTVRDVMESELPGLFQKEIKKYGIPMDEEISQGLIHDITRASKDALQGKYDQSKRVFENIFNALQLEEIPIENIPEVLRKHKIPAEQFAKEYALAVSRSGRILGWHSGVKKRLAKTFANEPRALEILQRTVKEKEDYIIDKVLRGWRMADTPRRAALVGQVATAMRNAWSQAGRISISAFDEAMQGAIVGQTKGSSVQEMKNSFNYFMAVWHRLSPKGRQQLARVLDSDQTALSTVRLISQSVHEVQLGSKYAKLVNSLNRGQEYFFRKLAFEAKTKQLLQRKYGLTLDDLDNHLQTMEKGTWKNLKTKQETLTKSGLDNLLSESTEYALEMTFAASPKSQFGKELVKFWSRTPLTTVNPFPRFAFANALPFLMEHSPLGYLKAFSPKTLEALASGNPERFAKAASRATIGTTMLESAMLIRKSEMGGEKWYEIVIGRDEKTGKTRTIDMRPYAPLSTYLFIAETMLHPERLKAIDYAKAAIGLNRIAGSGMAIVDLLRAKTGKRITRQLQEIVGEYVGGYGVPFRTIVDIVGEFRPNVEGLVRERRENPLWGPFVSNFPFLGALLPEMVHPLKADRVKQIKWVKIGNLRLGPIVRQMVGLSAKDKNIVQREVDKLALDWSVFASRTGIPAADRVINGYTARMVSAWLIPRIKTKAYQKLEPEQKEVFLRSVFSEIKKVSRIAMIHTHPQLAIRAKIKQSIPEYQKRALNKLYGIEFPD